MQYLIPTKNGDLIEDGAFIQALEYCKKHCSSGACNKFYQELTAEKYNTFLTCPHGMSVYCFHSNGKTHCFTCMRGKGTYKKEAANQIGNKKTEEIVYNPILEQDRLLQLIIASVQFEEADSLLEEKRASIDSISHEVKKLNAQIKARSDDVLQTYGDENHDSLNKEDLDRLIEKIKTIYVCSSMINSRFSLFDYEKNPQVLSQGAVNSCTIYKKFDKMRIIFSNYLGKRVPITLHGSTYRSFWAYPMFEMIPLLLVDNAVKYSYGNNPVDITFTEEGTSLFVDISSYSPYCSKAEIEKIFNKGFRGKNAIRVGDGSGIGLYFVKLLCDLHKIEINITSDGSKITEINGVAFAPFNVNLKIADTF